MEFKEAYLGLTEEDWNEILDKATESQLRTLKLLKEKSEAMHKEEQDD